MHSADVSPFAYVPSLFSTDGLAARPSLADEFGQTDSPDVGFTIVGKRNASNLQERRAWSELKNAVRFRFGMGRHRQTDPAALAVEASEVVAEVAQDLYGLPRGSEQHREFCGRLGDVVRNFVRS